MIFAAARDTRHDATLAACLPTIVRFGADVWPEAGRDPKTGALSAIYATESGQYTLTLSLFPYSGTAGGSATETTRFHWTATFPEASNPTAEDRDTARDHTLRLLTELAGRLEREVPVDFVRVTSRETDPRGSLLTLARIAADRLGDPTVFRDLVEKGVWRGTMATADRATVHLELKTLDYHFADNQALEAQGCIRGDDLRRLGAAAATAACEAALGDLINDIATRAANVSPSAHHVAIAARPHALAQRFFGTRDLLVATRVALRENRASIFPDGVSRMMWLADPVTRAEIEVKIDNPSGGEIQPRVGVWLDRSALDGTDFTAADRQQWQAHVDGIAQQLADAIAAEPTAPMFDIQAPVELVMPAVTRRFAAMFPSQTVGSTADGLIARNINLDDSVWTNVYVTVTPTGEWTSRVIFTGWIWGSGVGNLRTSQRAFRDAVADSCRQLAGELARDLDVEQPGANDAGELGL